MGGDGGSIPGRQDLVVTKKRGEQKDKDADRAAKWRCCALSQQSLQKPIMACELGRLYNKDSILEFLLDRSKFKEQQNFEHIRSLKDVTELVLTPNPSYQEQKDRKGDAFVYGDKHEAAYICPVIGLEMNGKYKFLYLQNCGCVFTERALKEIKTDVCHKCGGPLLEENVVMLNGTDEEVEINRLRMVDRRARAKAEKKAKKRQLKEAAAEAEGSSKQVKFANGTAAEKPGKSKLDLLRERQRERSKQVEEKPKSIQADPKSSKVYKSLFTTCKEAKTQEKGHWVTHNPFYS